MLYPKDDISSAFVAFGRGAKGDTGEVSDAELAAAILALKGGASAGADTLGEIEALLALKAPLASPALTGNPTAPTQAAGNNSTKLASTAFVHQELINALVNYLALSGGTMTGPLTLSGDPASALHAATKQYVDNLLAGLNPKHSVRAATTANITLSGAQTIDGVAVVAGDRVLVKNQSTSSQNGIYDAALGSWTRSTDADAWVELPAAFVFVEEGTAGADTGWTCTSNAGGTLGSTAVTWVQFSSAGVPVAGSGILKTGLTFSLDITGLSAAAAVADADLFPVSQSATNLKQTFTAVKTWIKSWIVKGDVGLGNVDNTSDTTKNAAAAALTNKDLSSGTNTFPTLNQNTTGSAAKLTTARNIDGQAFDGTANITVIAPGTVAATGKTTPVDADVMPLADSAAANVLKKVTWANVKATLKTYFDTLYELAGAIATHAALTATHGATGAVVGTTNTQALSNKTVASTVTPITGFIIDGSGASMVLTAGSETVLAAGAGTLTLTDGTHTGSSATFLFGQGVVLLGQTGTIFQSTDPGAASNKIGVYFSGGANKIRNGFAVSTTVTGGQGFRSATSA